MGTSSPLHWHAPPVAFTVAYPQCLGAGGLRRRPGAAREACLRASGLTFPGTANVAILLLQHDQLSLGLHRPDTDRQGLVLFAERPIQLGSRWMQRFLR